MINTSGAPTVAVLVVVDTVFVALGPGGGPGPPEGFFLGGAGGANPPEGSGGGGGPVGFGLSSPSLL